MGLSILIKTTIIYFFILIIMKFMGKREIGQLSLFDFVILLLIADVAVMGIDNEEVPFYIFLIAIIILAAIQKILAIFLLKKPIFRNFFDGKESVIIIEGKANIKEMKKQNYNFDDLVVQLRLKNIRSLSEVRFLILEANGEISIFKYSDYPNSVLSTCKSKANNAITTNSSSSIENGSKQEDIFPFPLIISGRVNKDNLKLLNLDEKWLFKKIKEKGYEEFSDVYYANYENGDLFILEIYQF